MAQAVSIWQDQLSLKQKSFAIKWTMMNAWNSMDNILAEVKRRVKAHASKAARVSQSPLSGCSTKALESTAKTKRPSTSSRGRKQQVKPTDHGS
jgi:hypothetical protein